MKLIALTAALCLLAFTFSPAQPLLSGKCSPNPAPMGTPIQLTLESTESVGLFSGCGIISVHQGSPTGPIVYSPFICSSIQHIVAPGFPTTVNWNGNNGSGVAVLPGTYYLRVDWFDNATFTTQPSQFFPVRIDGGSIIDPILTTQAPATRGTTMGLTIDEPNEPGATYILAASLTTNTGFDLGTQHVALDNDALFALSFPAAFPPLFMGFVGVLDSLGHSAVPSVFIPNLPSLQGVPLAIQGVVLGTTGLTFTNPLTMSIQ